VDATRICLDTTFLIDHLRDLPAAVEKARELKEIKSDLSTTSINAFEAYIGAIRSASPRKIAALGWVTFARLSGLILGSGHPFVQSSVDEDWSTAECGLWPERADPSDVGVEGCVTGVKPDWQHCQARPVNCWAGGLRWVSSAFVSGSAPTRLQVKRWYRNR